MALASVAKLLASTRAARHAAHRTCGLSVVPVSPRILTRAGAATYCGLSISGFDAWVRKGTLPQAIRGTRRWDRVALDRALDGDAIPDAQPSALDKWLAGRES